MRTLLLAVLLTALCAAGCGGRSAPSRTAGGGDAQAASGHAAGIVPGSYADWCEEHGVPETQCTRCDATLIAAFQATGDWDPSHGLPKSQCTTCDPNLKIVRPPRPEGK